MGRISKTGYAHGTSGSPEETLEQQEYEIAAKQAEKQLNLQSIDEPEYNTAKSIDVKDVFEVNKVSCHKVDISGVPNSVTQNYDSSGVLISERYYNEKGNAYLDIDYTDHGNPKMHPVVPHQHKIEMDKNDFKRDKKGTGIKK